MDITRIADMVSERICDNPQELLNNYANRVNAINFVEFDSYCSMHGVMLTEDAFFNLLANSDKYLFTESENGWTPTSLNSLKEALDI
jgi:hypothetical protein